MLETVEFEELALECVDFEDDSLSISPVWSDLALLRDSMDRCGLQSPPLLAAAAPDRRQIVCGFRRFRAARQLGWRRMRCQTMPARPASELFLLQLHDNLATRPLSEIERARAVERLRTLCGLNDEEIVARFSPLLGGSHGRGPLRRLRQVDRLPEALKAATVSGTHLDTALSVGGWSREEQQFICALCAEFRPGRNRQKALVNLLRDLRQREDSPAHCLWNEAGGPEPGLGAEPGLFDRTLERLRRRRYPRLTRHRDTLRQLRDKLDLPDSIRLEVPADFEGDRVTVRFEASSADEIRSKARQLAEAGRELEGICDLL